MRLKDVLRLYNLNWNQVRQNWNFNRLFVLLSRRVRIADPLMTERYGSRREDSSWDLSSRIYRPWHRSASSYGADFSPDVMVVAQHGRFGNMIRQITLALGAAERLGIREVLVKSLPYFPRGTWALDNGIALTHDPLLRPRMIGRPRLALGGDFFVKPRLPVPVDDVDFDVIGQSLAEIGGFAPEKPLPVSTMVIHFRSGDAFSERPHGALGQPPASFYRKAIEHTKPVKVVLVFENEANPTIEATKTTLTELAIPFEEATGEFLDDLAILLSAKTLVTAYGTFAEAVMLLSPHLEKWISYGTPTAPYFRRRAIDSSVFIYDPAGHYSERIMRGNWSNSKEQRDLMLSFPLQELELEEISN